MSWRCKLCGEDLDDADFWNHMFDDHVSEDVKLLLGDYHDAEFPEQWDVPEK
jgi:hypothetical protein